jgi:hypothetical protein
MTAHQRSAWIFGIVAVVGYITYLVLLFVSADGGPLVEAPYQGPLVGTVVGAIIANIVLSIIGSIIAGTFGSRGASRVDVRDLEISQMGERVGVAPLVLGSLVALVLALVDGEPFWIANALYLGFVLSAVLGTAARLSAYSGGLRRGGSHL